MLVASAEAHFFKLRKVVLHVIGHPAYFVMETNTSHISATEHRLQVYEVGNNKD